MCCIKGVAWSGVMLRMEECCWQSVDAGIGLRMCTALSKRLRVCNYGGYGCRIIIRRGSVGPVVGTGVLTT